MSKSRLFIFRGLVTVWTIDSIGVHVSMMPVFLLMTFGFMAIVNRDLLLKRLEKENTFHNNSYYGKKMLFDKIKTNLHQYGIVPPRAILSSSKAQAVLANSIPKAGTNLLIRAISLIDFCHRKIHKTFTESTEREFKHFIPKNNANKILVGHLPHSKQLSKELCKSRISNILMVRDPRDIALSNVHYIQSIDKAHRLHKYFSEKLFSFDERLSASICGIPSDKLNGASDSADIGWHIRRYLGWINDCRCLVIRFEDLIGMRGGGTKEQQHATLKRILGHLNIEKSEAEIAKRIFNTGSRTFNKGSIGQWKYAYTSKHIEQIEQIAGDCIDSLGYRDINY